jgi:cyclopropane fatty-acyl-phospholipid synthase-like methyltransferase
MSEIVREGYLRNRFDTWRNGIVDPAREEWLQLLMSKLDDGARVLELGCGSGREGRRLAERFRVTGVDLVPRADGIETIEADFLELELPDASYDACVSFYVFNHVPRDRLAPLLAKIRRWLVPGGWFMHAFGTSDMEAWTGEWLGGPTFFSSFPPDVNSGLVAEAGLAIERDEVITMQEPEGPVDFQWILARR